MVNVLKFVFDSLLVCKAYFSRFALFWLDVRCDDPRPVIDIAVDRDPCCEVSDHNHEGTGNGKYLGFERCRGILSRLILISHR